MLTPGGTHRLLTVALAATIDSTGERVWRAITEPSQRLLWDDRIVGAIEPDRGDAPRRRSVRLLSSSPLAPPIQKTRWRFLWSGIPLVLVDEVHRTEGHERSFGRFSIGSMRFDQTLTVSEERDDGGPRSRLAMKLVANNSIAVFGELVPRLEVQRLAIEYVDTTLRLVRKHCEADTHPSIDARLAR